MIPISITAEALVAIAKTFPMGWRAAGSSDGKGEYRLVLPRGVADSLEGDTAAGRKLFGCNLEGSVGSRAAEICLIPA
jgi:hypothetical protein